MTIPVVAHYVLGLQIEMDNGLGVHVVDALADLAHEQNAIVFGELKVVGHDPFEEFAASDAVRVGNEYKLL